MDRLKCPPSHAGKRNKADSLLNSQFSHFLLILENRRLRGDHSLPAFPLASQYFVVDLVAGIILECNQCVCGSDSHRRVLVICRLSELGNARLGMHCTQSGGSGRPHFRLLISKGLFCHLSCSGIFREQA